MTDKIDETIQHIFKENGVAIGRDDPILILQTINNRLLQDSTAAQQKILEIFKSEMEENVSRWDINATNKAERTLAAALAASKDAMTATMQNNAKIMSVTIQQDIVKIISDQFEPMVILTRRVSVINIIAASMAMVAACMTLLTVFKILY